MNAQEPAEVVEVIEADVVPVDSGVEPADAAPPPEPPDEPSNPDAWLQWALVIGLLALFLICTLLILIAWNDR